MLSNGKFCNRNHSCLFPSPRCIGMHFPYTNLLPGENTTASRKCTQHKLFTVSEPQGYSLLWTLINWNLNGDFNSFRATAQMQFTEKQKHNVYKFNLHFVSNSISLYMFYCCFPTVWLLVLNGTFRKTSMLIDGFDSDADVPFRVVLIRQRSTLETGKIYSSLFLMSGLSQTHLWKCVKEKTGC